MKVAKVDRYRVKSVTENSYLFKTHLNPNLSLGGDELELFGPGFSFLARGKILHNLRGNYGGADYHLCLEVMVETRPSIRSHIWERWYITFSPLEKKG